jgi:hypothetical protein
MPPIYNFITGYISPDSADIIANASFGLALIGHTITIIAFWKGTPLVRFALSLVYLPFLQYTLWTGDYAGAPRYLYISSIGFSILLTLLFIKAHKYLCHRKNPIFRVFVPGIFIIFLLANLFVIQTWVQRHIENGKFRQPNVTQLARDFRNIEPNSRIFIEVPAEKFTDLSTSCYLVLQQPVHCTAFVKGEYSLEEAIATTADEPVYWLQATNNGLNQIYPPHSTSQ